MGYTLIIPCSRHFYISLYTYSIARLNAMSRLPLIFKKIAVQIIFLNICERLSNSEKMSWAF